MKHIIAILLLALVQISYGQKMLMFKEAKIPYPKTIDESVNNWNSKQRDFVKLSTREQEFYYWVNYSRENPRLFFDSVVVPVSEVYPQLKGSNYQSLYDDVNKASSLPLLNLNESLIKMAKAHALDIVSHNAKPAHNSTNGQTFSDRFKQGNFKACGGENISFGGGEPIFLLILLYLDIGVPELGHRKALLNPNYTETGIGAANYTDGNIFLVEDFSCPQN